MVAFKGFLFLPGVAKELSGGVDLFVEVGFLTVMSALDEILAPGGRHPSLAFSVIKTEPNPVSKNKCVHIRFMLPEVLYGSYQSRQRLKK